MEPSKPGNVTGSDVCQICDDQDCSAFPLKLSLCGPQSFLSRDVRICFTCIDDLFFGLPTGEAQGLASPQPQTEGTC